MNTTDGKKLEINFFRHCGVSEFSSWTCGHVMRFTSLLLILGSIQRSLAWPMHRCQNDMHKSRSVPCPHSVSNSCVRKGALSSERCLIVESVGLQTWNPWTWQFVAALQTGVNLNFPANVWVCNAWRVCARGNVFWKVAFYLIDLWHLFFLFLLTCTHFSPLQFWCAFSICCSHSFFIWTSWLWTNFRRIFMVFCNPRIKNASGGPNDC